MRHMNGYLAVGLCVLSAFGCGSGKPGCVGTTVCGGDLVGAWKIYRACLLSAPESPLAGCAGGTVVYRSVTGSGTADIKADGTIQDAFTIQGSVRYDVPKTCFGGVACAQIEVAYPGATCVDQGSSCQCEATQEIEGHTGSSSYWLNGDQVRFSFDYSAMYDYCRKEGFLWLRRPPQTPVETDVSVLLELMPAP